MGFWWVEDVENMVDKLVVGLVLHVNGNFLIGRCDVEILDIAGMMTWSPSC